MAHIQLTNLNPSDSEAMEELAEMEELTEEELLEINGGKWFHWVAGAGLIVAGVLTSPVAIGAALIGAGGAVIASDSSFP